MSTGRASSGFLSLALASLVVLQPLPAQAAKQVVVPRVVGMKLVDAKAAIQKAGMQVMYTAEPTADASRNGTVSWQDPPGNAKVTDNTTGGLMVRIRYYQVPGAATPGVPPPPAAVVPNVVGMTETEAERALAAVGLGKSWSSASKSTPTNDPKLAGRVASQQPPAGASLARGKAVAVVLYSGVAGAATVKAPRVVGLTNDAATRQLSAAGLAARHVPETSPDPATYGKVMRQDPAPDAPVARGSQVTLWVGKAGDKVSVPKVVGMTIGDASSTLTKASLLPRLSPPSVLTTDATKVDRVAEQSPAAAQSVAPKTQVTYRVFALDTVKVPKLVMAKKAEALEELRKAGLTAEVQAQQKPVGGGAGRVYSQRPDAGSTVVRGSKVLIVVTPGG